MTARFTCFSLLEKTKVLAQQGREKQLSYPQVDPGHGDGEEASSAACRQGAGGKGENRRVGGEREIERREREEIEGSR